MTITTATDAIAFRTPEATRPSGSSRTGGASFADLLKPIDAGTPIPDNAAAPAGTGKSADPSSSDTGKISTGKTFRMDNFARELRTKTDEFNDALNFRLERAGVDTSVPITLDVGTDGTIAVRGDHPDKDTIERLFANDPEFAARYREISSGHTMMARTLVAARYEIALKEADDPEEKERVERRFEAFNRQLDNAANVMTVSNGLLSSAAMTMTTSFLQMPAWAAG